jgi:hypothetical protein
MALLSVQACSAQGCSDVGGANGLGVEIPASLYVESGEVVLRACDASGCEQATRRLGHLPAGVPTPVGRGASVSFDALGRDFAPGAVKLTVTLRDSDGTPVARRTEAVTLTRSYPNGTECDGDGFVSGSMRLRASDRL